MVDFQHLECVELAGGGGAAVLGSGRRSSRQATLTSQVAVQILLQGVGEDVELASEGVAKQILQDGAVVQDLVEAWPPDPGCLRESVLWAVLLAASRAAVGVSGSVPS